MLKKFETVFCILSTEIILAWLKTSFRIFLQSLIVNIFLFILLNVTTLFKTPINSLILILLSVAIKLITYSLILQLSLNRFWISSIFFLIIFTLSSKSGVSISTTSPPAKRDLILS